MAPAADPQPVDGAGVSPASAGDEHKLRRSIHPRGDRTLSERVKSGHLWTPQIRPFRRPETGVEFYFTASCVCKVVWILVRQLRGPHFSTCA